MKKQFEGASTYEIELISAGDKLGAFLERKGVAAEVVVIPRPGDYSILALKAPDLDRVKEELAKPDTEVRPLEAFSVRSLIVGGLPKTVDAREVENIIRSAEKARSDRPEEGSTLNLSRVMTVAEHPVEGECLILQTGRHVLDMVAKLDTQESRGGSAVRTAAVFSPS